MTQYIDIEFRERITSAPLNKRFLDIFGPAVLSGYRLGLGSDDFSISLLKGSYSSSVAITPSGVRVEEDWDLLDVVQIQPNHLNAGNPRVDSIYLVYNFGTEGVPATYKVIPGIGGDDTPAANPNPNTHLLLGYVNVPPQGAAPIATDLTSVNLGINVLEVANSANFNGAATFKDEVVFEKAVRFLDGTEGAEDPNASFFEQLAYPITATAGQRSFTVPKPYVPNSNTLHVYKNWTIQPPSVYTEDSPTTFRFLDPLAGGEKIWFKWARNISLYTEEDHNHDELYYRKDEVNSRSMHYSEDFFAGELGRVIYHFFDTLDYIVLPPTTVDKAADVGEVTVEKTKDTIVVYNTGTYRGKFDLSYYLKNPYQYVPNDEDMGFFDITSTDLDETNNQWRTVLYKRKNGTLYLKTSLDNYDARGYYRRVKLEFYNTTGTAVINTKVYALDYNDKGMLYQRILIPE